RINEECAPTAPCVGGRRASPSVEDRRQLTLLVGRTRTCLDQIWQAAPDVTVPSRRAEAVALELGNQTLVREADFSLGALDGDFKNDVRTLPLGILDQPVSATEVVFQHVPDNLLVGNDFG